MDEIKSLADVRPGDMYVGNISGGAGAAVEYLEILNGDGFRLGQLTARHIGIVVDGANDANGYTPYMAQAMPGGANIIGLTPASHWTSKCAYVRLPEDYPGQAMDAAAIALAMVEAGVGYSWLSYAYLAAWHWGWRTDELAARIDRRRPQLDAYPDLTPGYFLDDRPPMRFPVEAICSQFFDQAWTLAGKQVMPAGTLPQVVTPGGLANAQWKPGVVWGGKGLL